MPKELIPAPFHINLNQGPKPQTKVVVQAKPQQKAKSEKYYMLVLQFNDGTGDMEVMFVKGQLKAREALINRIDEIDVYESFVLVEDVPFGDKDGKPSVFDFLTWIQGNYSDGFDINDYSLHKKTEVEEFEKMQSIMDSGDVGPTYQAQNQYDMLNNSGKEIW